MKIAGDPVDAINILVNIPANDTRRRTEGLTVEDWGNHHAVNLRSCCLRPIRVRWNVLARRRIDSQPLVGILQASGIHAYEFANAGITGLAPVLAREFGLENIRVNAIAPDGVDGAATEFLAIPDEVAVHSDRHPLFSE